MPAAGTGQQNAGHTTNGSKIGQIGLRSFAKESLEDECNGQPSEVDNDQLRAITEADPFNSYMRSCRRIQ